MKNFMSRLALSAGMLAMLLLFIGVSASAQDPRLPPTFGTANLRSPFAPDPYMVKVVAGGPIYTTRAGVSGYVANAPDFRVNYVAGRLPLAFYVRSQANTPLFINLPDGTWFAYEGPNPMLRLNNPASGQYDIWVGTAGPNPAPAVLHVTELR